jgi:hypothetical protein
MLGKMKEIILETQSMIKLNSEMSQNTHKEMINVKSNTREGVMRVVRLK